jgi:hypothetical protein
VTKEGSIMATDRKPVLAWLRSSAVAILMTLFLLTAVGATGVFAFVLCPQCSPFRYPEPDKPLPSELSKPPATEPDKNDGK